MKTNFLASLTLIALLAACQPAQESDSQSATTEEVSVDSGQSGVQDEDSQPDVVKVAVGSPDHTTLVKAVQAAGLVDALANAGPFTVFAPTNAAFDKLPAGTVETLLKPENKDQLKAILEHHVCVNRSYITSTSLIHGCQQSQIHSGDSKVT